MYAGSDQWFLDELGRQMTALARPDYRPDHRLAIRLEREGNDVVVTIRVADHGATRRYRSIPSLDELSKWIADEDRG